MLQLNKVPNLDSNNRWFHRGNSTLRSTIAIAIAGYSVFTLSRTTRSPYHRTRFGMVSQPLSSDFLSREVTEN